MSKEKRSLTMSKIRSQNTSPEILLRRLLWKQGMRFRIHDKTIFGTPDISNKSRNVAVFVDGCFWHGCRRCYVEPKSNIKYWREKILRNRERRKKVLRNLNRGNWKIIQVWEHELKTNPQKILEKVIAKW